MKSPLALDKQTVQKYKISEDVELPPHAKLAFLQNQLGEIQAMHWRARVDMLHAARLQESQNETIKDKGFRNMSEHRNAVEQSIGAIQMLRQFIEELRQEYPELQTEQ